MHINIYAFHVISELSKVWVESVRRSSGREGIQQGLV